MFEEVSYGRRFQDYPSLQTWLTEEQPAEAAALYIPGEYGRQALIGQWFYNGSTVRPAGAIHLSMLPAVGFGAVTVPGATSCTVDVGADIHDGLVRFWDVSTGTVLGERDVTVVGTNVSWTGALAGMAAGDALYNVEDMVFSIGEDGSDIVPMPGATVQIDGSGLTVTGGSAALMLGCWGIAGYWGSTAEVSISRSAATSGQYAGVGIVLGDTSAHQATVMRQTGSEMVEITQGSVASPSISTTGQTSTFAGTNILRILTYRSSGNIFAAGHNNHSFRGLNPSPTGIANEPVGFAVHAVPGGAETISISVTELRP